MIVERKGVEKAILPDKVETTIYITTTTLLVLSLEQDQGSSQNCTTQATVMETAPGTTRRLGDVRRKQERSPPNDHLLAETRPRERPQERSPVRAPLPSPDPPTPKLVFHANEKVTRLRIRQQ